MFLLVVLSLNSNSTKITIEIPWSSFALFSKRRAKRFPLGSVTCLTKYDLLIQKYLQRNYVSDVARHCGKEGNAKMSKIDLKELHRPGEDRYQKTLQWREINNLIIATIYGGQLCKRQSVICFFLLLLNLCHSSVKLVLSSIYSQ